MQPWRRKSCRNEPRCATGQGEIGAHLVQPLPHGIAIRLQQALTPIAKWVGRAALPKRTQLVDARFRRIAGDQRAIDGADRNAGDPVRMKSGLGQCLIDTGLIRPERATPLKEQRYALEWRTRPRSRSVIA